MHCRATGVALAAIVLTSLAACRGETPLGPAPEQAHPDFSGGAAGPDTLLLDRDTYIASADNTSRGARDSLVLDGPGFNRALVHVSQTALAAAVDGRPVSNAMLEFTIKGQNSAWPAGGATVDVHRVLKDWTEAGATWNCAIDANIGNSAPDCSGVTAWNMASGAGTAWQAAESSRITVARGQTGVIGFDVTADVQTFLEGTASNYGWLVKRTTEGSTAPGRLSLRSREASVKPRLVLTLLDDQPQLYVVISDGVSGTPAGGVTSHAPGATVPYSFTLQSGYDDLLVAIDGAPVPAAGTFTMDSAHVLQVSARKTLAVPPGAAHLLAGAQGLLTTPTTAVAQAHLDDVVAYARANGAEAASEALAIVYGIVVDPVRDSAALDQLDDALANHVFLVPPLPSSPLPPVPRDSAEPTIYLHINGINTTRDAGRVTTGFLDLLVRDLPIWNGARDTVRFFYNRTRRAQALSETPAEKARRCARHAAGLVGRRDPGFDLVFQACMQATSPIPFQPDVVEAFRQYMELNTNSALRQTDADSLSRVLATWHGRGQHIVAVPHSQGNMMLQQALLLLRGRSQYDPQRDSAGIAAVALAAPTSMGWELEYPYRLKPIDVDGDAIGGLNSWGPGIRTPLSDLADAELTLLTGRAFPQPNVVALGAWVHWRLFRLHSVDSAYFGQQVVRNAIRDSLVAAYKELTVGTVTSNVPPQSIVVGERRRVDGAVVKNRNGRELRGRKLALASTAPGVVSVDTAGVVRGGSLGDAHIIVRSWQAADTILITVAPLRVSAGWSWAYPDSAVVRVDPLNGQSPYTRSTQFGTARPGFYPFVPYAGARVPSVGCRHIERPFNPDVYWKELPEVSVSVADANGATGSATVPAIWAELVCFTNQFRGFVAAPYE